MADLKAAVVRGGLAKIVAQALNLALRLGSVMVLSRLLNPEDFGLLAMATAIAGLFNLFKDAGLSMATVQRQNISHEQMSTLFWVNALVGLVLGTLMASISPLIANFYHDQRLHLVVLFLSTEFLLIGLTAQHNALLQRKMRFTTIALIDMITLMTGIAVAIHMAMAGWGYWSLVGQYVSATLVCTLCTWHAVPWLPSLPRRGTGIRSMIHFGGLVTLNNLVIYLAYNLEKILLGRYWGAAPLGNYGRAYQLVSIPTETLNSSVFGVAFSALSRIQDDPKRQNSFFLKGYSLLLTATLPITVACAVFAEDIIAVALGPKWQDSVQIFRFLTPTILIFALINPFAWLFYATGRAGRSVKQAFVIAPLVISAYLVGLPHGPIGVAMSYSAVMTLWAIPHIAWSIHGTGISGRDVAHTISKPFVSSLVAAGIALVFHSYLKEASGSFNPGQFSFTTVCCTGRGLMPFFRLTIGGTVMIAVYLWMLLYVMGQKDFYLDLLSGLKKNP